MPTHNKFVNLLTKKYFLVLFKLVIYNFIIVLMKQTMMWEVLQILGLNQYPELMHFNKFFNGAEYQVISTFAP